MHFNISHVTANPIVLTSAILAAIGWLVLFIGACTAGYRGYTWWMIVYELLILAGLYLAIAKSKFHHYRLMFLIFLGISITMLTQFIDDVIGSKRGSVQATAAGALMIILVQYFWVLIFGSSEDSWIHQSVYGRFPNSAPLPNQPYMAQHDYYHSTSVPVSMEKYKVAEALHTYKQSADDPNELSFDKGETLEIIDEKGNWWQARKQDGSIGIVPSNYFSKPKPKDELLQ